MVNGLCISKQIVAYNRTMYRLCKSHITPLSFYRFDLIWGMIFQRPIPPSALKLTSTLGGHSDLGSYWVMHRYTRSVRWVLLIYWRVTTALLQIVTVSGMGYDQGVIYLSNIQRMRYVDKKWKLSIQWMFI